MKNVKIKIYALTHSKTLREFEGVAWYSGIHRCLLLQGSAVKSRIFVGFILCLYEITVSVKK